MKLKMSKGARTMMGGIAFGFSLMTPAFAAPITQLALMVDSSGSIGSSNFGIFKNGIAAAMGSINTNSTVEVTVVKFDSSANTIVAPTLITNPSVLSNVINSVNGMVFTGGNTCYSCAFNLVGSLVDFHTGNSNYLQLGNMLTDGGPNTGGNGLAERNALVAKGLDILSFEGIGLGPTETNLLKNILAYPQPGVSSPPYPNPITSNGFVTNISNFSQVQTALEAKFEAANIGGVNVPEIDALAGTGALTLLAGALALANERRKHQQS